MNSQSTTVRELALDPAAKIPLAELRVSGRPVVLRRLVSHWPLVTAGRQGMAEAMGLMARCYSGKPVKVYTGEPAMRGRFAYQADCSGLNYRSEMMNLLDMFSRIRTQADAEQHHYYYINSLLYTEGFPGLQPDNSLRLDSPGERQLRQTSRIWIGTESRASAHWDVPDNIAACVVGRRRFTLFPPEQVANLYPGPLHGTPGGQAVTLVDLQNPDFERFPRLRKALDAAIVVDLEPGDVVYYPAMWWHEVEAVERFNVMINYWWTDSPAFMGNPMDALMHAILELRDRPDSEKAAWRAMFDYYVFGPAEQPRQHLPQQSQGALGELDDDMARRLRALLRQNLNR